MTFPPRNDSHSGPEKKCVINLNQILFYPGFENEVLIITMHQLKNCHHTQCFQCKMSFSKRIRSRSKLLSMRKMDILCDLFVCWVFQDVAGSEKTIPFGKVALFRKVTFHYGMPFNKRNFLLHTPRYVLTL